MFTSQYCFSPVSLLPPNTVTYSKNVTLLHHIVDPEAVLRQLPDWPLQRLTWSCLALTVSVKAPQLQLL